jgi:hypothetical protein
MRPPMRAFQHITNTKIRSHGAARAQRLLPLERLAANGEHSLGRATTIHWHEEGNLCRSPKRSCIGAPRYA